MKSSVGESKSDKVDGYDKWEIEGKLETLIKAREILKDKKCVAAIKKLAATKTQATAEVMAQLEKKVDGKMKELYNDQ